MGVNIGSGPAGQWFRVHAVSPAARGTADADYAAVLPAALHAARSRKPFIAGWLSRGSGAPLELITNAGPLPAPDSAQVQVSAEMLFPWGAHGAAVDGNMLTDLDQLVWAPCPGRQVPPLEAGSRSPATGRFEAALQTLMARPFGWLIVADPTDLLDAETAELRNQLDVLRRYDEENAQADARRAERRLAELDVYREAGLWNVRVLVGAASEEDLQLIAPVLVGAADLSAHPYRLRCPEGAQEFADVLAAKQADPVDGSMVPFAATAGALAALTGLPEREVPGVRVLNPGYFDLTSEASAQDSITLGEILDGHDRSVGLLHVPLSTLNRHALVTGATGAGKSHTVRHMLAELTAARIGWLAVEPVKSEYRLLPSADIVINPADPRSVPLSVNPLQPEPGYPVQAHIDMVRALFMAAFDAREPFPQIMVQALERAYDECGWDLVTGGGRPDAQVPPAAPTLSRLRAAALAVIDDVGYGPELQADMRGFVDVRLRSLQTGTAGRFFEGGHPASIASLLRHNVVLALDEIASDEDKAFIIGTMIIRIVEHLRVRADLDSGGLKHVIVLEEAHRLLRSGKEGASGHAVELFAGLLSESRAYGEGIVIAEQIPAKLIPDAIKNSALKIVHRLPAADDRQIVGATMNLDDDQSRHVVSLLPGQAAVFADGMDRPMRVKVPSQIELPEAAERPAMEPPIERRRSAACGMACISKGPCTLAEIRASDLLAKSPQDAWLRVWSEVYVLAHLVNRPLPRVPVPLRERWAGLEPRLRECLLATATDQALLRRSQALRDYLDPAELAASCAKSAAALLDGGQGAGTLPGTGWVIPQLQWLHEIERVCPFEGSAPDPFALAPALDFLLPDLANRADVKVGQRVSGLRRHRLSMEVTVNRLTAWTALLGEDDQQEFISDLAAVAIGVSHRGQLRKAAGEMGVTGWLEAVLSWPRRFIVGADDQSGDSQARESDRVAG